MFLFLFLKDEVLVPIHSNCMDKCKKYNSSKLKNKKLHVSFLFSDELMHALIRIFCCHINPV